MSTLKVNTIKPQSGTTVAVTGTLDVSGTIKSYAFETITELSTAYSGSNSFGNSSGDIHQFTGSMYVSNALGVSGSSAVKALTATTISGSSTLQAVGATTLGSTLGVSGSTTLAGSTSAQALTATTISGSSTLQVVGNTILGGNLSVSGSTTFTSGLGAVSATTISGSSTLQAVGATTLGSTLNVSGNIGIATSPSAPLHVYKAATTATTHLEMLRLEVNDEGVDMNIGHGPGIDFYVGETGGSNYGGTVAVIREIAGDADSAAAMVFHTSEDDGTPAAARERMRITSAGYVGIGVTAPGTQFQIEGSAPYVTLKNDTAENTDGGCESKIIFEDHTNVTLAQIQGSHDGSSDDTKGDLILSTHNGSALTTALTIDSSQLATFAGDLTVNGGDILIAGATPKLTIGDGGAEDTMLVFDGNAVDFRLGLDDGNDQLELGLGSAHGTTAALTFSSAGVSTFSYNVVNEGRVVETLTVTDENSQNVTLLAAEIKGGIVLHTSASGAGTTTTDTAANIVAGIPLTADNQCVKCYYINDGDQEVTFAGGTGVTIADTAQLATPDGGMTLIFRRTGATAVTMYMIGGAPTEG